MLTLLGRDITLIFPGDGSMSSLVRLRETYVLEASQAATTVSNKMSNILRDVLNRSRKIESNVSVGKK